MTDFSKLLNPEQCASATAGEGPILCLAAAGTGKTRTLVHRVAYLVEKGVPADRIILLTFTNRAAREMLERARALSGDAVASIWSGTFHSICAKLLRRYGMTLGHPPGFKILDEDDQKQLIGEIIKETVKDPKDFVKKEIVAKMISESMNEERDITFIAARWLTKIAGVDVEAIEKIASQYVKRKAELKALDFDDLLVEGLKLLETQKEVREILQEHFLYVLVDEYQDTNSLQARFTDILAAKHRNIMAVGDDFQCIYTWRGAQIENILQFPQRWPGCKIFKLERNYRSVPEVLELANSVMEGAASSFDKRLKPIRTSTGNKIPRLYHAYDGRSQAAEILEIIKRSRAAGVHYRDMAVLYRSHFQSIEIQITLGRAGIPFHVTSGVGVFEQVHIKDTLSYLRLLKDSGDELSFLRLVKLLPGIGAKSASSLWAKIGKKFDSSSNETRAKLSDLMPQKARAQWNYLSKCFNVAHDHLQEGDIGAILEDFTQLFYEECLLRDYPQAEAEERLEDIMELSAQIAIAPGGLEGFLSDVALMTNLDDRRNDPSRDMVTLSTVHQSKGMEWPVVMIPWCCEGLFPSAKAIEEARVDEERRLFYVALTRAKDRLSLFVPEMRRNHDGGMFPVKMTSFLNNIPYGLLEHRQAVYVPEPVRPMWRR